MRGRRKLRSQVNGGLDDPAHQSSDPLQALSLRATKGGAVRVADETPAADENQWHRKALGALPLSSGDAAVIGDCAAPEEIRHVVRPAARFPIHETAAVSVPLGACLSAAACGQIQQPSQLTFDQRPTAR